MGDDVSRNLLHKSKLPEFIQWCDKQGIMNRPGRGDYDVHQFLTPHASWQCLFDRHKAPEHYTVAKPLEGIVRQFIKEQQ